VYDPGLAAGWALRRSLANAGVRVSGRVLRGRRPQGALLVARKARSLGAILAAANTRSDNLAAEMLVRAMGAVDSAGERRGTWERGLRVLRSALARQGLTEFWLGNGSGLHRESWVTARLMVRLLARIQRERRLRQMLLPTLAVAGRSGTLSRRMRDTAAEGVVLGKTGTLGSALALSGLVDPDGALPLAFSIIVNGRSTRAVRDHIDRIAVLFARYARGLPLEEPLEPALTAGRASPAASMPATDPVGPPSAGATGQ
jgi:D-alanyl-D-alanine carboxypeptidase/D-alanyl-D-alanine-endopeptidase (penicillin-binding protein 4)